VPAIAKPASKTIINHCRGATISMGVPNREISVTCAGKLSTKKRANPIKVRLTTTFILS
jgi:hypothetical protein